jgi:sensor domain CHASE-containing protein
MLNRGGVRRQLLVSLSLMAVVFVSLYLPLTDRLISKQFENFEINEAQDEARRLELLLNERLGHMRTSAIDYADWTPAADYALGKPTNFIEDNFFTDVFVNLDNDYVFIVDRTLSVRYLAATPTYAGQPASEALQPLPISHVAPLLADPRMRRLLDKPGGIGLIVRIGERWHMVGASPITTPGPPPLDPSTASSAS